MIARPARTPAGARDEKDGTGATSSTGCHHRCRTRGRCGGAAPDRRADRLRRGEAGGAVPPPGYRPPPATGGRGIPDNVVEKIAAIDGLPPNPDDVHSTQGRPGWQGPERARPGRGPNDCVIVGAGGSGLATAKVYRDRFGPGSRILIPDPLPTSAATRSATSTTSRTPRPGRELDPPPEIRESLFGERKPPQPLELRREGRRRTGELGRAGLDPGDEPPGFLEMAG